MAESAHEDEQVVDELESDVSDSKDVKESSQKTKAAKKKPVATDESNDSDSSDPDNVIEDDLEEEPKKSSTKKKSSSKKRTKAKAPVEEDAAVDDDSDSDDSDEDEEVERPVKASKTKRSSKARAKPLDEDDSESPVESETKKTSSLKKRAAEKRKARRQSQAVKRTELNVESDSNDESDDDSSERVAKRKKIAKPSPADDSDSTQSSGENESDDSTDDVIDSEDGDDRRKSRKSMRIKKLKAKRRRKKSGASDSSEDEVNSEEVVRKRAKVDVTASELVDEEFEPVANGKVTLDPPAKAKRQAKEAKSKKVVEVLDDIEEIEVVPRKKKATKRKVVEVDELDEVEVVASKPKSKPKRKAESPKVIEELDDEIEEVVPSSTKKSKATRAAVKEVKKDPKKARRTSRAAKDIDEIDDDAVVEVVKKPKRTSRMGRKSQAGDAKSGTKERKRASRDSKSEGAKRTTRSTKRDAGPAKGRTGRRSRRDDIDDDVAPKKGAVAPAVMIGGVVCVLVVALIFVASLGQDPQEFRKEIQSSRAGKYKTQMSLAIGSIKASDDENLEKLRVANRRLKVAIKTASAINISDADLNQVAGQARTALVRLGKNLEVAKNNAVSNLVSEANELELDGQEAKALHLLLKTPADLRECESWNDEAVLLIDQLQKAKGSANIGSAILARARSLKDEKKYERALGVLAGFPDDLYETNVGEDVEELQREISLKRAKEYEKEVKKREAEAIARKMREQREAAERAMDELIASEESQKWQKQTGRDLFTWQIRQDRSETAPVFKLEGKTIIGRNLTNESKILAKNKADWRSFVVEFDVFLEKGTWHFHALSKLITNRGSQVFGNQVKPTQKKGAWVKYKIYVIRGTVYEVVEGGTRKVVDSSGDTDAKKTGGFGFLLDKGTVAKFRNIRAKVLEPKPKK